MVQVVVSKYHYSIISMMSNERVNAIISRIRKRKDSFLIGTAASAHQVEGNNDNDWTQFERIPGNIVNREKSGLATDHYTRFDEDFTLLEQLGFRAHRLSIEWSRIIPEPGKINSEELDHYQDVLRSLHHHNQINFVTLHHFTSPTWFIKKGGFKKRANLQYWEEFVKIVCEHLGNDIDVFNTINEPFVYDSTAYLQGTHAPGEKSMLSYIRVGNNVIRAHFIAVDIIRKYCPSKPVGIVKNLINMKSRNRNPVNKIIRSIMDWGYNSRPLKALKQGRTPFGWRKIKRGDIGDFIGINYYIKATIGLGLPDLMISHMENDQELTQMGWGVNPEGMKEEIKSMHKLLGLPVFITENGIATENDNWRIEYISQHLEAITDLIDDGIDIRGYFYWSNLDNFEWAEGYTPKFGLIKVDPETKDRSIKESGKFLGYIASEVANGQCDELIDFD